MAEGLEIILRRIPMKDEGSQQGVGPTPDSRLVPRRNKVANVQQDLEKEMNVYRSSVDPKKK